MTYLIKQRTCSTQIDLELDETCHNVNSRAATATAAIQIVKLREQ